MKTLPIKFRLSGIKTEEFAIINEAYSEDENSMSYSINTNIGVLPKQQVLCSINFKLLQKDMPFVKIKIACFFEIEKESWDNAVDAENKQINLPKEFADHIVVLTLGTLRGALHAKTEGTKFNRFFVPTINVAELSKDIETLSLELNDPI